MAMMTLLIILPILLLIIIAFVAFSRVRISLSKTRLVVGLYLALLFVSVPVFYAIAEPGGPEPMPEPVQTQIHAFYDALDQGRLSEYEGAEIIAQWSFDYQEEYLKITAPDYERYATLVAVERKDVRDGKLEVLSYAPKSPYSLTANPPDIRLKGNQLGIIEPEKIHLQEVRFYHDYTMAQFTGMGFSMERTDHFILGHMILYLRIPEDIRIDTDESLEHSIQFVNE